MLTLAAAVTAARRVATEQRALATIGKLEVSPNATNAIAERVSLWLDVRAESETTVENAVAQIIAVGARRRRRKRGRVGGQSRVVRRRGALLARFA